MIDMSVTLIAFLGFVAVILAICGITYLNADSWKHFSTGSLKHAARSIKIPDNLGVNGYFCPNWQITDPWVCLCGQ